MRLVLWIGLLTGCTQVVNFETPRESGEQCTDDVDNDGNGATDCADLGCAGTAGCLGCGDGQQDFGEECDDNNNLPNDGCSAVCRIEICGDGEVTTGEDCDDGNADDTDDCLATCVAASCGDGAVQAGAEECDDANAASNDGCASCVIERCGDGVPQSGPTIINAEFLWLASSCAPSDPIRFLINGVQAMSQIGDPAQSCNCAPPAGFRVALGETPQMIDGFNTFEIDYGGTDQYLAWALVLLHTTAGDREIVLYEGVPGAAAARATSMCSGGFDEAVTNTLDVPLSLFEECDDGNANDEDGCRNDCRAGSPP